MSRSEQRRAINRSRKAFAFFSVTGKAGTEMLYTDCPEKFQTEANRAATIVWDLFFINFLH
jgi:hypothetical protein